MMVSCFAYGDKRIHVLNKRSWLKFEIGALVILLST